MVAGRDDGDNDWEVLRDGYEVGRIYSTMLPDPERSWKWFVQVGTPGTMTGLSSSPLGEWRGSMPGP